MNVE
jgi:26S proteasome regulatory subunit T5